MAIEQTQSASEHIPTLLAASRLAQSRRRRSQTRRLMPIMWAISLLFFGLGVGGLFVGDMAASSMMGQMLAWCVMMVLMGTVGIIGCVIVSVAHVMNSARAQLDQRAFDKISSANPGARVEFGALTLQEDHGDPRRGAIQPVDDTVEGAL